MRPRASLYSLALLVVCMMGALFVTSCVRVNTTGSGDVTSETRQVEGFDEIELSGQGILTIEQGDRESLRIRAEDNIIPEIITTVRGDRLRIRYRTGFGTLVRPTEPVEFFVTVRNLNELRLSGATEARAERINTEQLRIATSGSGRVDMNVSGKELDVQGSGSSRFTMSGGIDRQRINISGSGHYDAEDLRSQECEIDISGSGEAIVDASERLDIQISGSGEVQYKGDPEVDQRISGSGRVRRLSE